MRVGGLFIWLWDWWNGIIQVCGNGSFYNRQSKINSSFNSKQQQCSLRVESEGIIKFISRRIRINRRITQSYYITKNINKKSINHPYYLALRPFSTIIKLIKITYILNQANNNQQTPVTSHKYQPHTVINPPITNKMKKSLKVKRLIDQNGIQIQNFTMVIRLKKIIEQLNTKIQLQNQTIMELKRDSKTTKINQMEVEIQHLNDQNKRLVLLMEQSRNKEKKKATHVTVNGLKQEKEFVRTLQGSTGGGNNASRQRKTKKNQSTKKDSLNLLSPSTSLLFGSSNLTLTSQLFSPNTAPSSFNTHIKKSYPEAQKQKQQLQKELQKQKKFQRKYYDLLEETEKLKKELINLRINEISSVGNKKRQSCLAVDKNNNGGVLGMNTMSNSFLLEKNMETLEKITQKKHDLQVENQMLKAKFNAHQKKFKEAMTENQKIKTIVQELKTELKCKSLLNSDKTLSIAKSGILRDLSNGQNKPLQSGEHKMTLSIF